MDRISPGPGADGRRGHDGARAGTPAVRGSVLVELRAEMAINLDGGSSAALIADGKRRNTPRSDDGEVLTPGEPVPTAVLLTPWR